MFHTKYAISFLSIALLGRTVGRLDKYPSATLPDFHAVFGVITLITQDPFLHADISRFVVRGQSMRTRHCMWENCTYPRLKTGVKSLPHFAWWVRTTPAVDPYMPDVVNRQRLGCYRQKFRSSCQHNKRDLAILPYQSTIPSSTHQWEPRRWTGSWYFFASATSNFVISLLCMRRVVHTSKLWMGMAVCGEKKNLVQLSGLVVE